MKLYLVRHGQTDMNKEKLYYGWTDCPINDVGRKQAETLHQYFKNVNCHKVITSDLKRSVETAEIIKEKTGLPYVSFDGDQTDPRNFAPAQFDTRVQALAEMMEANLAAAE